MPRFPCALLLLLAATTCSAQDLKAVEDSLVGEWWEQSYRDAFELRADRTATRRDIAVGVDISGVFSVPAAGRLRFAPGDGSEPVEWVIELKEGRFTVPIVGDPRAYVRESRADRDARLAEALRRAHDFDRSLRWRNQERPEDAGPLIALRELEARADGLLLTLAGPDRKKQDDYVVELAKTRPELRRVLDKRTPGGRIADCKGHLKMVSVYLALYESKFGKCAKGVDDIWLPGLLQEKAYLRCPATGEENAYEILEPSLGTKSPSDEIVAYERFPHADGTRCVLTFGGRVAVYDEEGFKAAKEAGRTKDVKEKD